MRLHRRHRLVSPLIFACTLMLALGGCDRAGKEADRTQRQLSRLAQENGVNLQNLDRLPDLSNTNLSDAADTVTTKASAAWGWVRDTGHSIASSMPRSELEARAMFLSWFTGLGDFKSLRSTSFGSFGQGMGSSRTAFHSSGGGSRGSSVGSRHPSLHGRPAHSSYHVSRR